MRTRLRLNRILSRCCGEPERLAARRRSRCEQLMKAKVISVLRRDCGWKREWLVGHPLLALLVSRAKLGFACLALGPLLPCVGFAQSVFSPRGTEYSVSQTLPGDQTHPRVAANASGGYVVWEDNATDGDGLGVSARALNNYLSPVPQRTFRVNQQGAGNQELPDVKLLKNGGAVFVWQSGVS